MVHHAQHLTHPGSILAAFACTAAAAASPRRSHRHPCPRHPPRFPTLRHRTPSRRAQRLSAPPEWTSRKEEPSFPEAGAVAFYAIIKKGTA